METINSLPPGGIPLELWRGKNAQRFNRIQARHGRLVRAAYMNENCSIRRLEQLIRRSDQILVAAINVSMRN